MKELGTKVQKFINTHASGIAMLVGGLYMHNHEAATIGDPLMVTGAASLGIKLSTNELVSLVNALFKKKG